MRYISPIIVTILLSGCSVGPDYQRPESATPTGWSGASDNGTQAPALQWWQGFGQEPLNQIMAKALQNNYDLAAAGARIRQADAQVRISSSSLLPTIQLGAGATRTGQQTLTTGKQATFNNFNIVPGASYEIDFWGKNRDARDAAQANAKASAYDWQTTHLTVQATVADTYFTILALQDRIAVAEKNLENALGTLDAFQARVEVGTASGLDVAQQESVVAEQRAALPPLNQQLRQNTFALAILTGALPETLTLDRAPLNTDTLPTVSAGLPSQLLARRPDVRWSEEQLIAANANIKANIASVYPSISLTAQGGIESRALNTLLNPVSLLFSIGASLTQPIFKGEALQGNIDLARAKFEELTATYQKTVISAFQDVEGAFHILKNHPGAKLPPSIRDKSINESEDLNPTFSATVGSIPSQPHGCPHCHKQYASNAKLLQHLRNKHQEGPATAPPCVKNVSKLFSKSFYFSLWYFLSHGTFLGEEDES